MENYTLKRFQLPDDGFPVDIGDGVASSFTITHPLNTKEVHVDVYRNSNGKKVSADVEIVDANHVTVSFAGIPTLNQYKSIIIRK